jgi:hypothetical protein
MSFHTGINYPFEGLQDDSQLYNAAPLNAEVALDIGCFQGICACFGASKQRLAVDPTSCISWR